MEESEKINRKKLPSIPSNYVTLRQLQERWITEKERKQKEKEEPQQEQQEEETKVDERVTVNVAGKGSRKNWHLRRYDRENGKRVVEGKPKEEEIATGFAVNESEGVEKEKKVEELKNEKKKKWKKEKKNKNKKEEKARVDNEGEEVVGSAVNAPLPASVENNKGEKEVIGDEVHAPKLASVEKENVEARRELKPRIIPRTDGQMVEIGRKFRAMSMKGEIRTGDHYRYGRQYGNFNHFGGNRELNRRYYGKFDRRREMNQRNEGMVWVKKGEFSDRNVSGIQSSSCSSKELD
ncbi:hypothetical protein CRYUN_Cryun30bG0044000 [Craigia yunnanensis]